MNKTMTNWKTIISEVAGGWENIIACTLTEEELNEEFDPGFGCAEGKPFTAWSHDKVFFPLEYDGSEWAGSAPRNPCDEATNHM